MPSTNPITWTAHEWQIASEAVFKDRQLAAGEKEDRRRCQVTCQLGAKLYQCCSFEGHPDSQMSTSHVWGTPEPGVRTIEERLRALEDAVGELDRKARTHVHHQPQVGTTGKAINS